MISCVRRFVSDASLKIKTRPPVSIFKELLGEIDRSIGCSLLNLSNNIKLFRVSIGLLEFKHSLPKFVLRSLVFASISLNTLSRLFPFAS